MFIVWQNKSSQKFRNNLVVPNQSRFILKKKRLKKLLTAIKNNCPQKITNKKLQTRNYKQEITI